MKNVKYYELTASEFDWSISPTRSVRAWGFNNSVPGPVLRANKGDLLVVKVTNNLPESTIVHWHGLRLLAQMDGTSDVQRPIKPGESFEYRFVVPDAGTFWYHSHHNETVQMERGMYGALVVAEENGPVTDSEKVLVFDDMKLSKDNTFARGGALSRWIERHDGRQGDTLLVNGIERAELTMNAGQVERWRLVNASSARFIKLRLSDIKLKLIATDGGLIERSVELNEVLLSPSERIDVLVGPFTEGDRFSIESLPYDRKTFVKSKHVTLASVAVGEGKESVAMIPGALRQIEPLASPDTPATRKVKFSVVASLKRGIDFVVNGEMHKQDDAVRVGELQVWDVSNTSLMDHPFHLHGFFFQVLAINGKAPEFLAWKDTVNLPPRSTVKIAWMPDNRPGRWMYHCHILEHHEAGMMSHFEVVDPAQPASTEEAYAHSCGHSH